MRLVETAIVNARLTISVLLFLMLAGAMAYVSIPKEAEPDIQIPILYVSLHYDGISPEDSERLLLRPMETALKSITGIKKMTSTSGVRSMRWWLVFSLLRNSISILDSQACRQFLQK